MFENIPEMIKKSYIITICISTISLVTGILLQREEIYLGFFTGSLIALLNTYLLILGAYKIIYIKANGKIGGTFEFIKRMIIFCIGVLFVVYISKKYYADSVLRNIVATGAGSLSFKFSIFINNFISRYIKKR